VSDLCRNMAIIHKGQVLLTGDPTSLVAGLSGRVWKKSIHQSEVAAYREKFRVISMRLFAGQTLVHTLNDQQPEAGFERAEPDLEDLYFATIRGFIDGSARPGMVN